jgi:predicted nucleic acid-binding protein
VDVRRPCPRPPAGRHRRGAFTLFTRDDCLGELARVLAYSQFKQTPERQAEIAAAYRARCTLAPTCETPACELPACLDRDDQKFLELARDSGARALVTRDKLVLKLGRRPVIAARFAILSPERLQSLLPDLTPKHNSLHSCHLGHSG